jgi:putative NADPH-quinone reductase
MKKILLINGHPDKESFNAALFASYLKGATEAGAEVRQIFVTDMPLENYLRFKHFSQAEVGPEIKKAQADITWADHLVFFHPTWWGGMPAILKCFIDMVFASGFAFKYSSNSPLPIKLLKGKTAHLVVTMDTPVFVYRYFFGAPGTNQLKSRILAHCGVTPTKVTYISPIRKSTPELRQKFLTKVYDLGKKLL